MHWLWPWLGDSRLVGVGVQVLITAEMPTAGGFYMSQSVDSIRLHPYIKSGQLFYLAVQLLFLVFTIVFVLRTVRDLMTMGLTFYSTARCWIDLCLAASSTFLIVVFIDYNIDLYDVDDVQHMHYRHLFYLDRLLQAAHGFVGFFAILRALLLCRYVPLMSRLVVVINKSSPHVVSCVVCGLIIWLMIASSTSALFGHEVLPFRSLSTSLASTVYAVSRVYHYESVHISHPLAASIFVMVFVLFFLYVARAMCAVGLLASLRDASLLPQPEETQLFFAQLAQSFRDMMSCVGFNFFRRKKKKQPTAKII